MGKKERKKSYIADKIILEYNQKNRIKRLIEAKKNRELKDKNKNESSNK